MFATNKIDLIYHQAINNCYFAPHPELSRIIANYTVEYPTELEGELMIIPDASGCFVFTFDGTMVEAFVWGPSSRAVKVICGDKFLVRFFVEFLPGGLYAVTGIPQGELVDKKLELDRVCPEIYKEICFILEQKLTIELVLTEMDRLFLERMHPFRDLPVVLVNRILKSKGNITVEELSKAENYSSRHLSRVFYEHFGLTMKKFARLCRINQAVRRLEAGECDLTRLAQEYGFFDQSHFIGAFKDVCGVTPTAFLNKMSDFYKEPFKF